MIIGGMKQKKMSKNDIMGPLKIREISEAFGISNSEVERVLSATINKIVDHLVRQTDCNMLEISCAMIEFFGMDGTEYIKKLNANHMEKLKEVLGENYHLATQQMEKEENFTLNEIFS